MPHDPNADWSPADHPYAIAVSEAQWWIHAVDLAITRLRVAQDGWRRAFSSRQIDARQLVLALVQVRTAETLMQRALKDLDLPTAVSEELSSALRRFDTALPGIVWMRNALTHFEDWSRGLGRGPQRERTANGEELRDIARAFSGFAYDLETDTITFGPDTFPIDAAGDAAHELVRAINAAAAQVDRKATADLRADALRAVKEAGISCDTADSALLMSAGDDGRIWLSLRIQTPDHERAETAKRIIAALERSGLQLAFDIPGQGIAERPANGDVLYVDTSHHGRT